jgi:luciferase-like monooxygenase
MSVHGARNQIHYEVLRWPGVIARPHRFGGTEYRLGKRELGHIHGDHLVDIPFPKRLRDEIVATGSAEPHHVLPETGWISFHLNEPGDIERAVALLRQSFELAEQHESDRRAPRNTKD